MSRSMRVLGPQQNMVLSMTQEKRVEPSYNNELQLKKKIQKRVEGGLEDFYKFPRVIDAVTSYLLDVFIQKNNLKS